MRFTLVLLLLILFCSTAAVADMSAADLNGDGLITPDDLKILARDLNTLAGAYRGDANGDGRVTTEDIRFIARALLQHVAPGAPLDDAAVTALIQAVMNEEQGVGSSPGPGQRRERDGGFQEMEMLLKRMRRQREQLTVEALDGSPPTAGTDGDEAGLEELAGRTYSPEKESEGRDAAWAERDFRHFFQRLRDTARTRKNHQPRGWNEITESRHRVLGGEMAERGFSDMFRALQGTAVEEVPPGESPDPQVLGEVRWAPGEMVLSETAPIGSVRIPKSGYNLRVNPDDPGSMAITTQRKQTHTTLNEEFLRASPGRVSVPEVLQGMLDPQIREFSNDPLLSQFLRDVADPEILLRRADRNNDRQVSRAEFLTWLFSPEVAMRIRQDRAADVGLSPSSPTVLQYTEIARTVLPQLVADGMISQAQASSFQTIASAPKKKTPSKITKAGAGTYYVKTTSGGLNMRSSPWGTVVGSLPKGYEVTVLGFSGDWAIISHKGQKFYVYADYLGVNPGSVASSGYSGSNNYGGSAPASEPYGGSSKASNKMTGIKDKMLQEKMAGSTGLFSKVGGMMSKAKNAVLSAAEKAAAAAKAAAIARSTAEKATDFIKKLW